MSVLSYAELNFSTFGKKSSYAYSSKVFDLQGGIVFTNAEPSMMMTDTCGTESGHVTLD